MHDSVKSKLGECNSTRGKGRSSQLYLTHLEGLVLAPAACMLLVPLTSVKAPGRPEQAVAGRGQGGQNRDCLVCLELRLLGLQIEILIRGQRERAFNCNVICWRYQDK